MWGVTEDLPADVRDTLAQLFAECGTALEEEDIATARETIDSARTVATNKLPEGEVRAHILHGCGRVAKLLDPDDDIEADAAGEYVAAMQRRLPEE
jgi:hypothetical protein